jgi:transglutaminase-like putative cysteine protease
MNIQRANPFNETLAKIIFLLLPTALVCYFLISGAFSYFSIIGAPGSGLFSFLPVTTSQALQLTLFVAIGMVGSAVFHSFRFRFLIPFAALLLLLWSTYKGIDNLATGEFDAFFILNQFRAFSILFIIGWLIGWGFIRLRYWSIFMSFIFLCTCIWLIADTKVDTVEGLLTAFLPALLYAVYVIFTSEQIYNYKDKNQKFWWYLSRRLLLFGLLAALMLTAVVWLFEGDIQETVDNYGGQGKDGESSMLKKDKKNRFDLKDYTKLSQSLGRSNELLFCAHIDNYFPGTDIPNPLYLTAFYYTKFDTLEEIFRRDSLIPSNDLFEPDPSITPLFATRVDSSVIKNSLGTKYRRTIEVEIYKAKLAEDTYLAPNVGYFLQPITVEKDFRDQFYAAFRAKSYISELNSAYFVYNAKDPQIQKFQEQRFEILREVKGYAGTDKKFMDYYTYMPSDAKFQKITELSKRVTANAKTPVDKVIAIRDYFLSKDEAGNPLFTYTDNPGIPDIPSASKLQYFLFENHKGYCAYYAGATLFMLRSLGIPSRITVGFMTVDRSDKNKGWYWYYADQAHAWVQVYFPGYGWMDFDTTVGNDDAQESPSPDGTPPMQPPKAWFAAHGVITSIDTGKRLMNVNVGRVVLHDDEHKLETPSVVALDLKVATIRLDSMEIPLSTVKVGDSATAVSYAEAFRKMEAKQTESGASIIKRSPSPAPIDEVYIKHKTDPKKEQKKQEVKEEKPVSAKNILLAALWIFIGFIILFLAIPSLVMLYYRLRNRSASAEKDKAYWSYRAATFYMNQVGLFRMDKTPMQYAAQIVDPLVGGNTFASFMNIYLKQKYAKQPLTAREQAYVDNFLNTMLKAVKSKISFGRRLQGFLNPIRAISFFVVPENDKQE